MLYQLLRHGWQALAGKSKPERLLFLSATRLTEERFWKESATGLSLAALARENANVHCSIAFENSAGLGTVYNAGIRSAKTSDILVFVHDDVWLPQENFIATIKEGLENFHVIGVAGSTRITSDQPAWCFTGFSGGNLVRDHENLSGEGIAGSPEEFIFEPYGPFPRDCELLDGVILAASAKNLRSREVWFDERFDFHFYDMDFCRTARQAGLRLGTWPLKIIHQSVGAFGGPGWRANYLRYLTKWAPASEMAQSLQDKN